MKRLHQRRGLSAYAARSGWGCPSRLERQQNTGQGEARWQNGEMQDAEAGARVEEPAGATEAAAVVGIAARQDSQHRRRVSKTTTGRQGQPLCRPNSELARSRPPNAGAEVSNAQQGGKAGG